MNADFEKFRREQLVINSKQRKINHEQKVFNEQVETAMMKIIKQFLNIYNCLIALFENVDEMDDESKAKLNSIIQDLKKLEEEVNKES